MGNNYKHLDKSLLTPRQKKLFNYLKEYKKENQYMPTQNEMRDYMNLKSKATVVNMLGYIEWKGYIKKYPAMARAIEILKDTE